MSFNLACMLRESANAHPDKAAILYEGGSISYADLDSLSDRLAVGLHKQGLVPGDAVGLQLPNIPQFVIAYFGLLKAGCVVVPMNVMLKAPETAYQLGNSHARALITWAGIADEGAKAAMPWDRPALRRQHTGHSPGDGGHSRRIAARQ